MTPGPDWHPAEDLLQRYVDGGAGPVLAASLEAHLLGCAHCRRALAPSVAPARLARVRAGLDDRVDAADRPWLERLLCGLGVREVDARVLLAAPSMRRAWWLAVLLALSFAVLAAGSGEAGSAALLVLAPLLPVLTTAAAYSPGLDPTLAVTAATPYPAMRLLLIRTVGVALASTVVAVAACAALPVELIGTLVWLLPAAALTAATLALSTWLDPGSAAGICCAAWLTAVWATELTVDAGLGRLAVYDAAGQLVSAAVLATAAAVLVRSRQRLDRGSPA